MAKHEKTLAAIFARPIRANIAWKDVEALFRHLGATVQEAEGSRVSVELNGEPGTFHAPHPGKELRQATVREVRTFLLAAGVISEGH